MRTLLICHEGAALDQVVLARWLGHISQLVGMVVLRENAQRRMKRYRREFKRVGFLRFFDVVAFRLYYKLFLAQKDHRWQEQEVEELCAKYPPYGDDVPVLTTASPNSTEARAFIETCAPDIMIARCKVLLREDVFSIPTRGTYVMHPGICPEYRNAHGCFWALASDDLENVGMTLLKIDRGVDTGPVFGYFRYPYDEVKESHFVIQSRVVLDSLDDIELKLWEIYDGSAQTLDTTGRPSKAWGQPWLTKYLHWKRSGSKRQR